MMIGRVCLIVNYNLYESKRYFTQKLSEAFQRHGVETKIIDVEEKPVEVSLALDIQRFNPDLTCSFNSLMPLPNKKFLWDILQIPHLSFIIDPVFYSIYLSNSPYSFMTCVDQADLQAMRGFGFNRILFWPHAVERELESPTGSRPYEITFLGSCYDYEGLRTQWQKENKPEWNKALDTAIELVMSDRYTSLAEALVTAWNIEKLSIQQVDFTRMFYFLDHYVRGKDRVQLIRSIKDHPIALFGRIMTDEPAFQKDWSYYLKGQKNVTLHPPVSYQEAISIMQQSKMVLNSTPSFKQGTHERIFASLACGAVPITSRSLYLEQQFQDGEEIIFYKMGQWEKVNEKIAEFLSNETLRETAASKGRSKVMSHHTWDQRVQQLLQEIPIEMFYNNGI